MTGVQTCALPISGQSDAATLPANYRCGLETLSATQSDYHAGERGFLASPPCQRTKRNAYVVSYYGANGPLAEVSIWLALRHSFYSSVR